MVKQKLITIFVVVFSFVSIFTTIKTFFHIDILDSVNKSLTKTQFVKVYGESTCNTSSYDSSTDDACVYLELSGGGLSVSKPYNVNNASFQSLTVSNTETTTSALVPIIVSDLRGNNSGWFLGCTMTNLTGIEHPESIIKLATITDELISKFRVTPTNLTLYEEGSGFLNGLNDNTSLQDITSLSSLGPEGTSNQFNLASMSTGNGGGAFTKNLNLSLDVPSFVRAQNYSGTLTCSVG